MSKNITLALVICFLIISCGYTTGTIQRAERSFVMFTGNLENVQIHIDDWDSITPSSETHYQLSPGKHTISAYRDGKVVLNRIIFLENQVVTEVKIP